MNLGKFTPKSNWSNVRLVVKSRTQLNRSFAGSISQSNQSIYGSKSQSHHVFVSQSVDAGYCLLCEPLSAGVDRLLWVAGRVPKITRRLSL
ncbi:hypothetical protein Hanom_Chr09g00834051 [Helianthus anomalus]